MNENPYQPPKSDLELETEEKPLQFYVVSIQKFTVLFFVTLGLYIFYWFYKNWSQYKIYNSVKIWPVPRAIFSIFFTHKLFGQIQSDLVTHGKSFNWKPNSLATTYVILSIVSNVLDRMSMNEIGSPYSDLLSILILPLIYFTLLKSQKAINLSQSDPEGSANNSYTIGNYVWIVFGLILWALSVLGLLIMFGVIIIE